MTHPAVGAGTALDAVTELLGLRPAGRPGGRPSERRRWGVVAGRSGPRFLVPLDHPQAATASCLAYLRLRTPRAMAARGAVGVALRARLGRIVVDHVLEGDAAPGSLLAHLEAILEDEDHPRTLAVAVGLGHRDEVWKPTLQAFRPDGTPAAFVKVGLGPVADDLVATEAATLTRWQSHPDPRLVVADLRAESSWNGLRLAVVAPLPLDVRRLPPSPALASPSAWAVRDLDGPVEVHQLAAGSWWHRRRDDVADHHRAKDLLERIEDRHGETDITTGRWHGDWVPWNLARCHRGLVAWDWEYSEAAAPVGLDEVHGAYQRAHVLEGRSIAESLDVAAAAAAAVHRAGGSDSASSTAPPEALRASHLAMLLARSAHHGRLAGRPPADEQELLAAAQRVLPTAIGAPR